MWKPCCWSSGLPAPDNCFFLKQFEQTGPDAFGGVVLCYTEVIELWSGSCEGLECFLKR